MYKWINKVEEIPDFLDLYFIDDIVKGIITREMTVKFSDPKWMSQVASKKYHSIIDQQEEGLSRHLQNTLFVAHELLNLDYNKKKFTPYEREVIKAACLMHDYGIGIIFPHEKWNCFPKSTDEKQFCKDISHLVHRHMGQWSKVAQPDCEMSYFVHMCDMIASRTNILIVGVDNYGFEC